MKQMVDELNRVQIAPNGDAGMSSSGRQSQRTGGFPSASTGISTDHHRKTRRFTFVSTRDLFVFCWENFFSLQLAFGLDLDIDCVLPGERSSLECINNFAFETGADWPRPRHGLSIATVWHRIACKIAGSPIFYLIDYRLRRQKGPTADRQTSTAFQAVGGRFFEVKEDGSWGYSATDALDADPKYIFEFVADLRRMARDRPLYLGNE